MLKQRVITALLLMAILLPTLWADALWPFALLSLIFIGAAGWEWARLNEAPGPKAWILGFGVVGGCLVLAQRWQLPVLAEAPGSAVATMAPHVHQLGEPLVGFLIPATIWWAAAVLWVVGGALALRYAVATLSLAAGGLGFLWSLIDRERRTWHDLASGTVLVRLDR